MDDRVLEAHAVVAQLVDEVDEDDRVRHHDADEHEQADERGDAQRNARGEEKEHGTGRGEGDRHEQDERLDEAAERRDHDEEDEDDRHEHRPSELGEGLGLFGAGTADVETHPGRQIHRRRQLLGGRVDRVELTLGRSREDRDLTVAVGAGDRRRRRRLPDLGDLVDGDGIALDVGDRLLLVGQPLVLGLGLTLLGLTVDEVVDGLIGLAQTLLRRLDALTGLVDLVLAHLTRALRRGRVLDVAQRLPGLLELVGGGVAGLAGGVELFGRIVLGPALGALGPSVGLLLDPVGCVLLRVLRLHLGHGQFERTDLIG
ncbi:Uncharacterised protein [Mycobacteroides abscessus subsp. abscessus]|nr:Uncharacterised protein [Mycobacteroides abscessus subsp. abscessus]